MKVAIIANDQSIDYKWKLGALLIATVIAKKGHDLLFLDLQLLSKEQLLENLVNFNPRYVLLSFGTRERHTILSLLPKVKSLLPKSIIVAGGHHVTYLPVQTITYFPVDIVVIGRGEKIILEILKGKLLKDISNIAYKENGVPIVNKIHDCSIDFSLLPQIDYLLPFRAPNAKIPKMRQLTVLTSMGCPFNCNFCGNQPGKMEYKPQEQVISQIAKYSKIFKPGYIFFGDSLFNSDSKYYASLFQALIPLKIKWKAMMKISILKTEELKLMKKSGCFRLFLGGESGNAKTIKRMNKIMRLYDLNKLVKECKKLKIETEIPIILGYFGENMRSTSISIKNLISVNPDIFHTYFHLFLPGTNDYEFAKKEGIITEKIWLTNKRKIVNTSSLPLVLLKYYKTKLRILHSFKNRSLKLFGIYLKREI